MSRWIIRASASLLVVLAPVANAGDEVGSEAHSLSGEVIGVAKPDAVGVKWEVMVPTVRVLPTFPVEWHTTKHGPCVVRVVLDEYGVPASAEVVTCDEVFQAAALEAVRGWRFEFDTDSGRSTRGEAGARFTMNFGHPDANAGAADPHLLADTRTAMSRVEFGLMAYSAQHHGRWPETLPEAQAYMGGGALPTDAWGRALAYSRVDSDSGYLLVSYGADGLEGGKGINADLRSEDPEP